MAQHFTQGPMGTITKDEDFRREFEADWPSTRRSGNDPRKGGESTKWTKYGKKYVIKKGNLELSDNRIGDRRG